MTVPAGENYWKVKVASAICSIAAVVSAELPAHGNLADARAQPASCSLHTARSATHNGTHVVLPPLAAATDAKAKEVTVAFLLSELL